MRSYDGRSVTHASASPSKSLVSPIATAPRFEILDGVRAVAFLAVFGFHFGLPVDPALAFGGVGFRIIPHLDLGVEIFFVLSGFLIFRPFAAANLVGSPLPRLRPYLVRRALRIYPAYWVALTVLLLAGEVKIHGGALRYFAHYSLVHTYLPEDLRYAFDGIGPAWSLVVEVSFYLLVPILGAALRRASWSQHLVAIASLTAVGFLVRALTVAHPLNDKFGGWLKSTVGVLPLALAALGPGMALAVLSVAQPQWATDMFRRVWMWWLVAVGGVVVLMVIAPTSVDNQFRVPTSSVELWHRMITPVIAVALIGPCVFGDAGRSVLFKILRHRSLVAVGIVSYGAYLWHHPLLLNSPGDLVHLDYRDLDGRSMWLVSALFVVFLAMTLVVAMMSWLGVEKPAQRLARRWAALGTSRRAG